MNQSEYLDLFTQWLSANGYSNNTIAQYPSRVRAVAKRLDLATSTPASRRALVAGYAPSTQLSVHAAYRLWRKWLEAEFPDQLAAWPPLLEDKVFVPPADVLAAVRALADVLGVVLLRSLCWEQIDIPAGRVYGRVAGVVVHTSVLARGRRVRECCETLLAWSMEGDDPEPGWPVVVLVPGSTRPINRRVLSQWYIAASAEEGDTKGTRSSMGPLPPRAAAPPAHLAEAPQDARSGLSPQAAGVEVPDAVKTSLRAALGREPSQAELHAAMGVE